MSGPNPSSHPVLKLTLSYNSKYPPVASLFCLSLPRDKKVAVVDIVPDTAPSTLSSLRVDFSLGETTETYYPATDLELAHLICRTVSTCRVLVLNSTCFADNAPSVKTSNGPNILLESSESSLSQSVLSQWLHVASTLDATLISAVGPSPTLNSTTAVLMKTLTAISTYLKDRTFLVGHKLSLADIAVYSVVGKFFGFHQSTALDIPELNNLLHLQRWLQLIDSSNSIAPKIIKSIVTAYPGHIVRISSTRPSGTPSQSPNPTVDPSSTKKQLPSFEAKLPGAVHGQVVVRFCPEPSGYLHIGHAKAALLNAYYAKVYDGKLLIRFDDTNPSKEKAEYEESIIEDLRLLHINTDYVSRTSNYFTQTETYCEKLLQQGVFYCDDTVVEQMRLERGEGIESQCRGNSIQENLRRWEEMKKGSEEGLRNCVRAKIDMQSKNKCMRDPVMYRCNVEVPHQFHGTRYKAYPVYDFACPIVDSLEGVTHALRANEYADRIPQYQWVLSACGLPQIIIYEFSRLNLVNTVLSKRKLQWLVDHGAVTSWDDPRFPTVRGIRRRGLTPQALMEFIMEQGHSKNVNLMEWDKLWAKNKQVLDPIVPRYMAVDAHAVPVDLVNGPTTVETKERDLHPKNPELGRGVQLYSRHVLIETEDAEMLEQGEEVTLMRWSNAIVESILKNDLTAAVQSVTMRLHPDGDFKKTKKKLHWIAASSPLPLSTVILREYDHMISKKKPEEDDRIEDLYNRDSIFDTEAVAEPAVLALEVGDVLQLERRGYFRVDQVAGAVKDDHGRSTPPVLIKIHISGWKK